jgi:hypothetical protein
MLEGDKSPVWQRELPNNETQLVRESREVDEHRILVQFVCHLARKNSIRLGSYSRHAERSLTTTSLSKMSRCEIGGDKVSYRDDNLTIDGSKTKIEI